MIWVDLIYNLALLISLSVLSSFVDARWKRTTRLGVLLQGVVFGGAAAIGMLRPFVYAQGLIFDGRSVMISLGGLFFGPWTAAVACLMTIPLRMAQGGTGATMGVLVIVSSAAIGVLFHLVHRNGRSGRLPTFSLLLFGIVVHLAMLTMTLALPFNMILPVLQRIAWPVMLTYPLATVLIGRILSDQAERAQSLAALQDSEQRFRAIFNSAFQFTGLMTPDGTLAEVNQTALDFAGVAKENVIDRPFWETPWWRGNEPRVRQLRDAVARAAAGEFVRYEVELQGVGTTTVVMDFSLKPVFDEVGRVALLIPEGRDITERRQAEEALRFSAERWNTTFDSISEAVCLLDRDFRVQQCNRAMTALLGRPAAELVGHRCWDLMHGTSQPLPPCPTTAMFLSHHRETLEIEMGGHWYHVTADPITGPQGDVVGAVHTLSDITERKRTEAALRQSEATLNSVFRSAPVGICIMKNRVFQSSNAYWTELIGYPEEAFLGKTPRMLYENDAEYERVGRELYAVVLQGALASVETRLKRSDGEVRDFVLTAAPLRPEDPAAGTVIIVRDVTESNRAAEELRAAHADLERRVIARTAELAAARDRAEAADRVKSAFLATMSHELRTPLNSIIGFTGLLLRGLAGPLTAEQNKQLLMVKNSGQHLLSLINDVLDISKIEAGQVEIVNAPFDLPESIQKAVQTVTPLALKKGLPLITKIPPDVSRIVSDRRRIEQILLNLLSNAIKFTEQGTITLTVERTPGELHISVADTGIGIKPEDMDKLFLPFRQVDSGLTRQHEGTGLGLAICRRLIERMGGTIAVESQWGKGSTFRLTLPVSPERES